jgi:hypothetical protein
MNRVMTSLAQVVDETARQLSVNEKLHAALRGTTFT